jgi:hypothetical protein
MTPATRLLSTLLLLAAAAAAAAPLAGQAVQGELRSADSGVILPGARLLLLSAEGEPVDSARTDRTGRFRLAAPAAGSYTVYFRIDGYVSVPSEPVQLAAGSTADLAFQVPLVSVAAVRQMSDMVSIESRLQESLPEICGEPLRAWEAGLLVGFVRSRATRAPVAGVRVAVADADGDVVRSSVSSDNGVYVLCNVPLGPAVRITLESPDGTVETTDVEIRPGTASWYDLPVGPRRR